MCLLIRRTSVNSSHLWLVANNVHNTASYGVDHRRYCRGGRFYCYSIDVLVLASNLLCGHLPPSVPSVLLHTTLVQTPCTGGDATEPKTKVIGDAS